MNQESQIYTNPVQSLSSAGRALVRRYKENSFNLFLIYVVDTAERGTIERFIRIVERIKNFFVHNRSTEDILVMLHVLNALPSLISHFRKEDSENGPITNGLNDRIIWEADQKERLKRSEYINSEKIVFLQEVRSEIEKLVFAKFCEINASPQHWNQLAMLLQNSHYKVIARNYAGELCPCVA